MSELSISAGIGTKGTGGRVDGGCEEHETIRAFVAEEPMLVGTYVWEEITFGALNLRGWSYRLFTWAATTVPIDALVGVGPTL